MPPPGHLPNLHHPARHTTDALWLPPGLCPRAQGQHRLSVPTQLVCADCKGKHKGVLPKGLPKEPVAGFRMPDPYFCVVQSTLTCCTLPCSSRSDRGHLSERAHGKAIWTSEFPGEIYVCLHLYFRLSSIAWLQHRTNAHTPWHWVYVIVGCCPFFFFCLEFFLEDTVVVCGSVWWLN